MDLMLRGVGTAMKVEEYIEAHCVAGTPMVGSQIPIQAIGNLSLNIIVCVLIKHRNLLCFTHWSV
jgi:hypothetical protein